MHVVVGSPQTNSTEWLLVKKTKTLTLPLWVPRHPNVANTWLNDFFLNSGYASFILVTENINFVLIVGQSPGDLVDARVNVNLANGQHQHPPAVSRESFSPAKQ